MPSILVSGPVRGNSAALFKAIAKAQKKGEFAAALEALRSFFTKLASLDGDVSTITKAEFASCCANLCGNQNFTARSS